MRPHPPTDHPRPRCLLGVWAHPDDEAYLSADFMAQVVDRGGRVTVVTATRGEGGSPDEARRGDPGFAAQREAELAASLGELGVTDLRILGLPDGGCDGAHPEPAISQIAAAMREVRPDTIVTFGPDGITGHPDHRAVSRWTTEAWRRTGQGRLLYAALSEEHVCRFAHVAEQLDLFDYCGERGPATVPTERLALHRVPHGADLDRKRRALAAHATQTEAVAGLVGEAVYRAWSAPESFRLPTPDEVARCLLPAWMSDHVSA